MATVKKQTSGPGEPLTVKGLGISDGIAIGKAAILHASQQLVAERTLTTDDQVMQETERFHQSLAITREQLNQHIQEAKSKFGKEYSAILESHFLMLEDEEMIRGTVKLIKNNRINAEAAFSAVMDKFKEGFLKSKSEYLRERVNDLEDVKKRLLANLMGQQKTFSLNFPAIILADTIKPSDIAGIERKNILGFVSESGSKLSHFAIVARSLNLPAVVGFANATGIVSEGDTILIDGHTGEIILHPPEDVIRRYEKKSREFAKRDTELEAVAPLPCITPDHREILLGANVELPEEVTSAKNLGAQGIGLYRTEYMLFSKRELPDEETQYQEYFRIASQMAPYKVTMRTFDVGGDKIPLEILTAKGYVHEDNPFLGWRAIRIALECPEFFIPQIRAMLRLSAKFPIEIMLPMIISLDEVRKSKEIISQCKSELRKKDIPFNDKIPVGIMIETPAAAVMAEQFAPKVDFFSIGTNDLVQYTLATDRGNPKVADLYNCFHPAVLHLLNRTIRAAENHHIHVAMCGEMASNPYAIYLLLGMGLQEFSALPPMLPKIKKIIRGTNYAEAKEFSKVILQLTDVTEIERRVVEKTRAILNEPS